jgi:hypothetical protein
MSGPLEFWCEGCGCYVIDCAGGAVRDPPLCLVCEFVATIDDPDERGMMRRLIAGSERPPVEAGRRH